MMKLAVLGTGEVGRTIASKLVALGHEVKLGARTAEHEGAARWATEAGDRASHGTFADAAASATLVFNCTKGEHTLHALEAAGHGNLAGKILVDVSNPLDFSNGFPPSLTVSNTDSMAEQIQRAHPDVKVVKALNTMWNGLMVAPRLIDEDHHTYVAGDDAGAKAEVTGLLLSFGWRPQEIIDLGALSTARGLEMFLPLWVRLYGAMGTGKFNLKIVKVSS